MPLGNYSRDPARESIPDGGGLPDHRQIIRGFPGVLDVVAVISNPCRYRSRYDLYRAFERHMHDSGVRLTTVELAFGARPWEVTRPDDPRHVRLRTDSELWHKENLINVGISRLPRDWEYIAWIDADITFARPDWAQATLHQLQHYAVVQTWSHAQDLGPSWEPHDRHASFCYCHREHPTVPFPDVPPAGLAADHAGYASRPVVAPPVTPTVRPSAVHNWHPGFAWAARRDAIEALGGLIDWAPLGAGDNHMARGLVGRVHSATPDGLSARYRQLLDAWQARATEYIKGNIGYVPGLILHHWHGPKAKRRYWDRWRILVEHGYDPDLDLVRDWQGVWRLTDRSPALRDAIRDYFRERDEDATS